MASLEPTPPLAPGLSSERTSLAWSRTVLGYLVVATACLRTVSLTSSPAAVLAAGYLCVAAAVALRRTPRLGRSRPANPDHDRPPVVAVLALSAVTAALSAQLLWFVLR